MRMDEDNLHHGLDWDSPLNTISITDETVLAIGFRNKITQITNGEYYKELSKKFLTENLLNRELTVVNRLNNIKDRINKELLQEANKLNINELLLRENKTDDGDNTEMIEAFINENKKKIKDLVNNFYIINNLSLADSDRINAI